MSGKLLKIAIQCKRNQTIWRCETKDMIKLGKTANWWACSTRAAAHRCASARSASPLVHHLTAHACAVAPSTPRQLGCPSTPIAPNAQKLIAASAHSPAVAHLLSNSGLWPVLTLNLLNSINNNHSRQLRGREDQITNSQIHHPTLTLSPTIHPWEKKEERRRKRKKQDSRSKSTTHSRVYLS